MTYGVKLAGIDRTRAQLNLVAPNDPTTLKGTLRITTNSDGTISVTGVEDLQGDWKKN
jgi:hypothetical protein